MAGAVALAASGAVFHALLGGGDSLPPRSPARPGSRSALCAVGAALTWAFVRDPEPRAGPRGGRRPAPEQLRHHQHHRRFHL